MNKQLVMKHSVVAVALTLATTHFAMAQEAAAKPIQVYVTGSNIKRSDKEGSSPVEVVSAKQIAETGANTVAELLHSIPAFGSGTSLDTTDGGFARGSSTASLRGLGSSSTLILLNGRRITASAYADPNQGKSAVYDLNNIPVSAIERVEIFKDGASAVYGSDAIAGVINFITKTNYNGGNVSVSTSANDDGKFGRSNISGIIGFGDLAKDRFNVFISGDYAKRQSTLNREVTDVDTERLAYVNGRLNPYASALTSSSPFFYRERTPNSRSFANTYALRADVINKLNCDPSQQITGSVAAHNILANNTLVGRTFCNFDTQEFNEAQSAGTDSNLLSKITFAITPDITSFTEIGYSRQQRDYIGAPRAIQSTSSTTVFALGKASDFQLILPVGHPDNPFPTSRSAVGFRLNEKGGTDNLSETARFLTGIKGTAGTWDWEAAALYNRNERTEHYFGFLYKPTIEKIMTQGRTIAATIADPSAGVDLENFGYSQVTQFDAKASTTLGKLPGGDIGLAFGAEVRQEKIGITPDQKTQNGDIIGLANSLVNGSRRVSSAFVEARTPFTKSFEMDFAGRYDKYPDEHSFVPKVGGKWTVSPIATLRGSYSRGFRAPALIQVSTGGVQSFQTIQDSLRCPDGRTPLPGADQVDCSKGISSLSAGTPDLLSEKSKNHSFGLILNPTKDIDILVDYYNIRKVAETVLLGAQYVIDHPDLYPGRVVRDQGASVQLPGVPNSGPITAVNRNYVNQGSTETSGIDFEIALRKSLGDNGKISSKLSWNYAIDFRRAERPGEREANAVGTNGGLSDWATTVGDIPRHRASWVSNWTRGDHSLTGSVDFVSSISLLRRSDNDNVYPVPYCHYGLNQPAGAYSLSTLTLYGTEASECYVHDWTTVGVSYTWTGIKNLSLNLNIRNLLDTKAPYDPRYGTTTSQGFNSQLHNGQGRYFKVTASYNFK